MLLFDCYFGRCSKPSCDRCLFRPVRAIRLALKSRAMERCGDGAVDMAGSWETAEVPGKVDVSVPAPVVASAHAAALKEAPAATHGAASQHAPVTKHAMAKKRKRLLAPREEIAWYPIIKPELCNGCGDCKILCKPGVFEIGPPDPDPESVRRPKLVVAHPCNCLVLCTRCVPICTSGAIVMPRKEDFEHYVEYVD